MPGDFRDSRRFSAGTALAACLLAAHVANASPPVWEMTLDQGKVRIAGSIHYLRDQDYPLPEILRRAYEDAETLVVEYDTRAQGQPVDPAVLVRRVPRPGRVDPPGPLRRHLSTPEFTSLRRLARDRGFDVDKLDNLKPWFAGMYVMDKALGEVGFSSDLGLDNRLLDMAHDDGKRVVSLESEADQRRLFGGISMAEQVDFLRYRPVLANDALKRDFGFVPRFDSAGCFDHYRRIRFGG